MESQVHQTLGASQPDFALPRCALSSSCTFGSVALRPAPSSLAGVGTLHWSKGDIQIDSVKDTPVSSELDLRERQASHLGGITHVWL